LNAKHSTLQLIPTKSDFGGGYNLSCNNGSNGSISLGDIDSEAKELPKFSELTELNL
jgi:hypothetical protein